MFSHPIRFFLFPAKSISLQRVLKKSLGAPLKVNLFLYLCWVFFKECRLHRGLFGEKVTISESFLFSTAEKPYWRSRGENCILKNTIYTYQRNSVDSQQQTTYLLAFPIFLGKIALSEVFWASFLVSFLPRNHCRTSHNLSSPWNSSKRSTSCPCKLFPPQPPPAIFLSQTGWQWPFQEYCSVSTISRQRATPSPCPVGPTYGTS